MNLNSRFSGLTASEINP